MAGASAVEQRAAQQQPPNMLLLHHELKEGRSSVKTDIFTGLETTYSKLLQYG